MSLSSLSIFRWTRVDQHQQKSRPLQPRTTMAAPLEIPEAASPLVDAGPPLALPDNMEWTKSDHNGVDSNTSDAASSTTLASTLTTASSLAVDASSIATTPDPDAELKPADLSAFERALTQAQGDLLFEVAAAAPPIDDDDDVDTTTPIVSYAQSVDDVSSTTAEAPPASNDDSSTRRTSTRLSPVTDRVASTTPTQPSTPAPEITNATRSTSDTGDNVRKTGLRIGVKEEEEEEAKSPEDGAPLRRTTKRASAITALALITGAPLPPMTGSKRSHEAMDTRSSKRRLRSEDEDEDGELPLQKKGKTKKVWINQGLYVGQDQNSVTVKVPPKKKGAGKGKGKGQHTTVLPLPIFKGLQTMDKKRAFKLPFNIFAPSPWKCPTQKGWKKLNHNVFIGDAAQYWKKGKASNIKCVCDEEDGCNDHCLNRCTWLECDDSNCNIGRECSNRAFADLKDRVKAGTRFAEGIEVVLTEDRGYGLRATRSFEAHQIIVEYTGEIITQDESERRMNEEYKTNSNYYLMLFDQNMILDATRGSVARFVNHSCEPNCRMEKWLVDGKPRMALFAGDDEIDAGSELTYDYNFNWFSGAIQLPCKCGSENCRGTLGKRTDAPRKPQPGNGKLLPKKASKDSTAKMAQLRAKPRPLASKTIKGGQSSIIQGFSGAKRILPRRSTTLWTMRDDSQSDDISELDVSDNEEYIPKAKSDHSTPLTGSPTVRQRVNGKARITPSPFKIGKSGRSRMMRPAITNEELFKRAKDAAIAAALEEAKAGQGSFLAAPMSTRAITGPTIALLVTAEEFYGNGEGDDSWVDVDDGELYALTLAQQTGRGRARNRDGTFAKETKKVIEDADGATVTFDGSAVKKEKGTGSKKSKGKGKEKAVEKRNERSRSRDIYDFTTDSEA